MPNPPSFYHLGGVLHIEQLPLVDQDFNRDKPIPSAPIPQLCLSFTGNKKGWKLKHMPLFYVNPTSQVSNDSTGHFTGLQANAREGLQRATWSRSAWSRTLYGAGARGVFWDIFLGGIETKEPAWDSLIHT